MTPEPAAARERMADLLDKAAYDCDGADLRADRIVLLAMADAVLADRAGVGGHCECPACGTLYPACEHDNLRADLTTAQATIAERETACRQLQDALHVHAVWKEQAEATIARLEGDMRGLADYWKERRTEMVLIHEQREQTLRDALHEVAWGGIEFSDTRVGYVTVQIDRATLDRMRALIADTPPTNVPRYAGLLVPAERNTRFNDTVGAFTWHRQGANLHPDRCVCQAGDATPHKHYQEPPYRCARCSACAGYIPADTPPREGAG